MEIAFIDEHWAFELPVVVLFFGIILGISRGRSRVARLVWTGITLLALASEILWPDAYSPVDRTAGQVEEALGWVGLLADIVSLGLLWSRPMSEWLRTRSAPAPSSANR